MPAARMARQPEPVQRSRIRAGSAGSYGWSGMAGTFFVVDPAEELFALVPGLILVRQEPTEVV